MALMRRSLCRSGLAVLLVCALACRSHQARNSGLQLSLKLSPPVPHYLDDEHFILQVKDASGTPVSDAGVKVSLTMTFMDMGTNLVPMHETAPGVYEGVGQFGMKGDWDCHVEVTADGTTATQIFHYKVA
jgi:hypothetical protein